MNHRSKKWNLLWILIPMIAVGFFFLLSINYLIDPNLYRNIIQKSLSLHLNREVTIGKAKINLLGGASITFEDLRVRDRSQVFDLLQSPKVMLKARLLPLLKKEIKWKGIVMDSPVFRLHKDGNGDFNFFDGPLTKESLKTSQKKIFQTLVTLFGGSLSLRNGEINFSDESFGDSPFVTTIRSFNLFFSEVADHQPIPWRLSGKIVHSKKEGSFSISGIFRNISEDMDLSKGNMKAKVEIKGIDILYFWPYLKTLLPINQISGDLDLNGDYQGNFSGVFHASARMRLRDVIFDYPQVFVDKLTPKWMNLDLNVGYDLKEIEIPQISVELPEIDVKAKGKIYGVGSKEMGLEAEAQSGPFDLSEAKKLIPYRIITPDVADPLSRAEGSGPIRALSVKLSGKISEIEHCDQLQHAHTLSVETKLDKIRLKLPWDLPFLEDFKGNLDFKEGHLQLKEVAGRFFHSRIDRANGAFYRLLHIPTLQASCEGRLDLMDLPSLVKIKDLFKDFSEILSPIAIHSGWAEYRLNIMGDLKPPLRFQHQGSYSLSNVRFAYRDIPFPISIGEGRVDLSHEILKWQDAKAEFGDSSILTNGSWRYREEAGPLEIMVKGRGGLKNLFILSQNTLLPEEIRLKGKGIESLSGTGSFSFKGRRLAIHQPFSFEGELMPKEANLLLKGISFPLTFRDGMFSFSNLGVIFSKMKVQSGNSFLSLDGSIKEGNIRFSTDGFIDLNYLPSFTQSPFFSEEVRGSIDEIEELAGKAEVHIRWFGRTENWIASLKEGEIKLKGAFLRFREISLPFSQIEGSLLISDEQLRFEDMKGRLGDSLFNGSGGIPRSRYLGSGGRRWLSFQISSPDLDLDLLFPKKSENITPSFERMRGWLSHWSIEGKVEATQVRYHGLLCQDLKVGMKTVDRKLLFLPFQFKGSGGDLWGEGWIEPVEKGIRFEIKPRLSNMEAESFLRALLQKGKEEKVVVTGRVSIDKAKLEGEGEDFKKAKGSLNGVLRLEIENGVIERFNVLSKIFSILNVSQLFKGRLPDLTTKGLPYHQIIGSIHVKDGIASTEDLVIESDAMKITLFGKLDLGENLIDAKIGIHPLVTLDTVLSNVPIAGYIITGKDNAFLSLIYEVKGDLDNPKIEAIPFKSMGEGFLGIIRRLLETPLRPFQKISATP